VSTSGWAWKYPGRLGDSPVIGAGNYADNRYGAAACTGLGEMTIRAGTAHSVVLHMQMGLDVEEACRRAMNDLQELQPGGGVDILALDCHGQPAAVTNEEVGDTYVVMTRPRRSSTLAPGSAPHTRSVSRLVFFQHQVLRLSPDTGNCLGDAADVREGPVVAGYHSHRQGQG